MSYLVKNSKNIDILINFDMVSTRLYKLEIDEHQF